ncbi:MAG TPA: GGDEF domain-containing protein [Solirubrobacterales bacterium]|jgi:diguanylate cyclase (GGDEF)-like protein|nr:GGDEF domain-containing protein [Solirubrobacterales bacterium]
MPERPTAFSSMPAFAEAPEERARMGRIAGALWILAALLAIVSCYLPGAKHAAMGWIFALGAVFFAYGLASLCGWLSWARASERMLGIVLALTIPVVGLSIYLTGGSISFAEPILFPLLIYATFFFRTRWAWLLALELIAVAGTPLLYDSGAIDNAFLPRYLTLVAAFLSVSWVLVGLRERLLAAEHRRRDIAYRDALTGVANRRQFDATLKRELSHRSQHPATDESPLALLLLDLDDLKGINDNHGHPVGDAVLRQVAERAESILRSTDTLARIGGDEFAVIAPGAHGEGARLMGEAIRSAIGTHYSDSGTPAPSASVGWAVFPDDGDDVESLVRAADERMLRSKRGGESRAVSFG